jgi:Tol biopolymer transport system component
MKSPNWIRALAVTALLASACGSTPIASATPSPSASPPVVASSNPNPTPASNPCPPPTNRCLALVTLRGSDSVVVRDLTDINHPKTISDLGAIFGPVFVSGTEISYANETGLFRLPLSGSPKTLIVKDGGGGRWSPDGMAVVYTTASSTDPYTGRITVHQFRDGHDQVLGSTPPGGAGGCEYIANCTLSNWLDSRLQFSPDGTLISMVVHGFASSVFRVWTSDGTLLASNDSKGITMSGWSGQSLYFSGSTGVQSWRGGVTSTFLAKTYWVRPSASAAGGQMVYTARDSAGWGHIYLVDTTTRKVRELKGARTDAVFLTSRFIWFEGERACVAADICGAHPPIHPLSGKTYIYDLQTGTESESIITSVADVWPHPA